MSTQTLPRRRATDASPALIAPKSSILKTISPKSLRRTSPRLELLAQSGALLQEERPRLIALAALTLSLLVFAFIAWAGLTDVSEVARAPGEVVPVGYAQPVQQVDGGIVQQILVAEGDQVQKGQTLIRLTGVGTERELDEAVAALAGLQRRAATLSAFRNTDSLGSMQGDLVALHTLRASRDAERAVIQDQLAQKVDEQAALAADLQNYRAQSQVNETELNGLRNLRVQGLITAPHLNDAERRSLDANGAATRTEAQIAANKKSATEYRGRLTALNAKYDDQAAQELAELAGKIDQAHAREARLREQLNRLDVTAPVRGIVKGLSVNSIGAVVAPGQTLMEIVPSQNAEGDMALAADIHVSPQDVGFVRAGQPVRLKVSAFDFARFGVFTGKIASLSPATYTEGATMNTAPGASLPGGKFYKARVTIDPATANPAGKSPGILRPGMVLECDIVLGQQSILGYLLKPIHVAATSALSER